MGRDRFPLELLPEDHQILKELSEKAHRKRTPCKATASNGPSAPAGAPPFVRPADDPFINSQATSAADIQPAQLQWLAEPWVLRGTVTLLTGASESGKTTLLAALAADATGGPRLAGGRPRALGCVVWVTAEEAPTGRLLSVLAGAGADLRGVLFPGWTSDGCRLNPLRLPRDFDRLEAIMVGREAALLVLDPIDDCLDDGLDDNDARQVRSLLVRLEEIARSCKAACPYTRHPRKNSMGGASVRVAGSRAWTQYPRVHLELGLHPFGGGRRVLAAAKYSIGRRPKAHGYEIEDQDGKPRLVLTGPVDLDADDLGTAGLDGGILAERIDGLEWLRHRLAAGGVDPATLWREAQAAGIGRPTYWRARRLLGCLTRRRGSPPDQECRVCLPGQQFGGGGEGSPCSP